jgi:hypothetical protein
MIVYGGRLRRAAAMFLAPARRMMLMQPDGDQQTICGERANGAWS